MGFFSFPGGMDVDSTYGIAIDPSPDVVRSDNLIVGLVAREHSDPLALAELAGMNGVRVGALEEYRPVLDDNTRLAIGERFGAPKEREPGEDE